MSIENVLMEAVLGDFDGIANDPDAGMKRVAFMSGDIQSGTCDPSASVRVVLIILFILPPPDFLRADWISFFERVILGAFCM